MLCELIALLYFSPRNSPLHSAFQWIVFQDGSCLADIQFERLQISTRQRKQTRCLRIICGENAQLDIVPIHLRCVLSYFYVRDH